MFTKAHIGSITEGWVPKDSVCSQYFFCFSNHTHPHALYYIPKCTQIPLAPKAAYFLKQILDKGFYTALSAFVGWRVLTQKPASRICHSNTAGDTFSVQCPYHCHLDLAAAPLPPDHLKQYATKIKRREWETNIKDLLLRQKSQE